MGILRCDDPVAIGTAVIAALVGAGTVLSEQDAERALAAGASFLPSPVLRPEVLAVARERGALAVPGAFTPTEVDACMRRAAGSRPRTPATGSPRERSPSVSAAR